MADIETLAATKRTHAEGAAPATPPAAQVVVYAKADGLMYSKDDAGTETLMSGGAAALPGTPYEVAYAEITSNASITATTEGTGDTVVTAGAVAFDGATEALIEFYCWAAQADNGAVNRTLRVGLVDGGTAIGVMGFLSTQVAGVSNLLPLYLQRRLTPSNASHTFGIEAWVSAGTGLIGAGAGGAGANMPAFIRVSKLTA